MREVSTTYSLCQTPYWKSYVVVRMVGKYELISVWTRKPGEGIGEWQEGGWGHALVKSLSEKEDKLPLWAPKNETQIIKADSLGASFM